MAIPSYEFYKDVFLGAGIAAEDWDRLATRADEQIMRLERGYTVTDPLGNGRDKAVCAIADQIFFYETNSEDETVSIGSVSVARKAHKPDRKERRFMQLAQTYLDIYRGVSRRYES